LTEVEVSEIFFYSVIRSCTMEKEEIENVSKGDGDEGWKRGE